VTSVIRIHRADNVKLGIYHRGRTNPYYELSGTSPWEHPEPCEEGHALLHQEHCGFKDVAQLKDWFKHAEGRAALFSANPEFVVAEYETEEFTELQAQIVFNPAHAGIVRVLQREEYV
jgi:hypothetical protein